MKDEEENVKPEGLLEPKPEQVTDSKPDDHLLTEQADNSAALEYASRLSQNNHKGKLNLIDANDPQAAVVSKCRILADLIRNARHVVMHTGAGISTASGIADFRGPNGVWTKERKWRNKKVEDSNDAVVSVGFEQALPTLAHAAITELTKQDLIKFVVSQNVDGLHLRSGMDRSRLAEVHGNVFAERCSTCRKEYIREFSMDSVGFSRTGRNCLEPGCDGPLCDSLLDWEDNLPEPDFGDAQLHSSEADLAIAAGTSLQMQPATRLVTQVRQRNDGKMVICNLSKTDKDATATLVLRATLDEVMARVMAELKLEIPRYEKFVDIEVTSRRLPGGKLSLSFVNAGCAVAPSRALFPFALGVRLSCEGTKCGPERTIFTKKDNLVAEMPIGDVESGVVDIDMELRGESVPSCRFKHPFNFADKDGTSVSQRTMLVACKDYGDQQSELLEMERTKRAGERHAESDNFFHKSFKKARFSTCVLCGAETFGSKRRQHLEACAKYRSLDDGWK